MNVKKITALLLTFLMLLGIAGCGEEPVEVVDNVSNGVDFFESLSKSAEFDRYNFEMVFKWTIPDFSDSVDEMMSEYSTVADTATAANNAKDAMKSVLSSIQKNGFLIKGTVVKSENNTDIAFGVYDREQTDKKLFDAVIINKSLYLGIKSLVNDSYDKMLIDNEYLLINVDGINSFFGSLGDIIKDAMPVATATDAVAMPDVGEIDENGEPVESGIDDNGEPAEGEDVTAEAEEPAEDEEPFASGIADDYESEFTVNDPDYYETVTPEMNLNIDVKLPEVQLQSLKTLIAPLMSGIQKTMASREFSIFSVDAQGYNVMKITQSEVLKIVKNVLAQYRADSDNLYNALQTVIKDSGVGDAVPSFTQKELESGLDDAIITVQDAIDFDELEGMTFDLEMKTKVDGDTCSNSYLFSIQKSAKQLTFDITVNKTQDSSASVSAPSNVCTLTEFVKSILPETLSRIFSESGIVEDPGEEVDPGLTIG